MKNYLPMDGYEIFRPKVSSGDSISKYMSQVNHPNEKRNLLIVDEILKFFK